jgi:hypothetical protein
MATDGYSNSPPNTLVDFANTHYEYVKKRIQAINSSRVFEGIVQASGWPQQKATDSALYMSVGNARFSRQVASWQGPCLTYPVRWMWMIIGTDLTQGVQASNRGNQFGINMQMETELLNGLFPGFCTKQQYSIADDGTGNAVLVTTPFSLSEQVWWSKPDFNVRTDIQSGTLFGYASVSVSSFAPEINS